MENELALMSPLLGEIINLREAADFHKKHCSENCSVSLYVLKTTANRLSNSLLTNDKEYQIAEELIQNWPK